MSNKLMQDD